jgi:hypothetical protein
MFVPILALSILVERLLETGLNIVEANYPQISEVGAYSRNKQIITTLVGIGLGVGSAFILGIRLFSAFGIEGIDPNIDKIFTGAIAGTLAPYSHQLLEAFLNLQKFLEALKEAKKLDTETARAAVAKPSE